MKGEQKIKYGLIPGLNLFDTTLLVIGSVFGSGIFLTTGDIALSLPSKGWILLVWIAGGLITLTGALTFGELGASLPRAGGQYIYLKEAYGSLAGFLYGWTFFLIIQSGGAAAIAAGFSEYVGYFIPFLSPNMQLLKLLS
ncbi:MAG: amino acid permease [Thermodesulfobacteriota bacterium]